MHGSQEKPLDHEYMHAASWWPDETEVETSLQPKLALKLAYSRRFGQGILTTKTLIGKRTLSDNVIIPILRDLIVIIGLLSVIAHVA